LILKYVDRLIKHAKPKDSRFSDCKSLVRKLRKEAKHHRTSSKVKKAIERADSAFYSAVSTKASSSSHGGVYGKYPEGTCSVLSLGDYAKHKLGLIEKLFQQCKADSTKNDPVLVGKTVEGKDHRINKEASSFAYLDNRVADLNASHVKIKNKVNFILAAQPKEKEELRDHLYNAIIGKDCSLWFTVNESKNKRFWAKDQLKNLKLPDGWTIKHVEEETVGERPLESEEDNKGKKPVLIKTTLIATKGKTERKITHYHFDNWLDSQPAPCEELLLKCALIASKYIEETGKPVGINCRAGIGRTGVLANTIYGIRHIQEEMKSGKQLKDITINLAELNYDLRKQRQGIVGNEDQFAQVWRVVGAYAKMMQQKGHN
jgi:protein tyrosine phosphatase